MPAWLSPARSASLVSTERALAEADAAIAAFEELTALRDAADAAELRRLLKPGTVARRPAHATGAAGHRPGLSRQEQP